MRAALECSALRVAAPKLTGGALQRAAQVLVRIDRQPERWGEHNTAFHTMLYKSAERPRLLAEILSLQRSVERYIYQEVKVTNNFADSQREHRKLLELISRKRIEEACSLLNDHILKPGRILVSKLRKSGHP
jgi:DNA-binding GntR family transcriptional regulator